MQQANVVSIRELWLGFVSLCRLKRCCTIYVYPLQSNWDTSISKGVKGNWNLFFWTVYALHLLSKLCSFGAMQEVRIITVC